MRLLDNSSDSEFLSIHIDSDDDLWYLRNIIAPSDMVKMTTLRRIEKQQDMTRSKETSRKPVTLTVEVESMEFQEFSGSLRVLGKIVHGSEDLIGLHQSFALTPGETFLLSKSVWSAEQRKLLDEALENKFSDRYYFIVLDDEEASMLLLKSYGIQNLGKIESHKTGKDYSSDYSEDRYLKEITDSARRMIPEGSSIIVLGPGFTREKMVMTMKANQLKFTIYGFPASRPDEGAVWEFLNSGESDKILENFRLSGDSRLVSDFLRHLKTDEQAAYGYDEVKRMLELGAVETLMISEDKFRTEEGIILLDLASSYSSKIHIISSSGDHGKIVSSFGGYCAILRYRIKN
ncbi:MAG: mRNA surveillance protein pelota [Candidatus Thermoplasmatota archaeon]|nr:mRNA surveillance protein pelota [Candidatus Thermoplasmatota archaeon]MDA8142359.1 mRNA surveillance protein pelota [Thermoplasmatales archaeon]